MIVSCPSCQRNYVVADEQIAGKQFRAKCKSCGVEFRLDGSSRASTAETGSAEAGRFMSATEAYLALQTAPPPSAGSWSVCLSQTDTRRMTTDEVVEAFAKGSINSGVFVWKNGMAKWVRLSEVAELTTAIGKLGLRISKAPATSDAAAQKSSDGAGNHRSNKPPPPARTITLSGGGPSHPPPPPPEAGMSVAPKKPSVVPTATNHSETASAASIKPSPPAASAASIKPPPPAASVTPGSTSTTVVRRSTPSPPLKAPIDIPIEVEAPIPAIPAATSEKPPAAPAQPVANPVSVAAANPAIPNSVSSPPTDAAATTAPSASATVDPVAPPAAAGASLVLPPIKTTTEGGELPSSTATTVAAAAALAQRKADVEASGEMKREVAVATSSTSPMASNRSDWPVAESNRRGFAGMIVVASAVGLLGVVGGVAGAVYVMKTTMGTQALPPTVTSVVVLQPQAALPAPVAAEVSAPATVTASVVAANVAAAPPPASEGGNTRSDKAPTDHPADRAKTGSGHAALAVASRAIAPAPAAETKPDPKPEPKATKGAKPTFSDIVGVPKAVEPKVETSGSKSKEAKDNSAPAPGAGPMNREAAMAVLSLAAARVASCKQADGPSGNAKVYVTFDPNGSVVIANVVGSPIAGTPVAQCVAGLFRKIRVSPFSGDRVSLEKLVTIPP